jgi:Ca2+-binding RTX toxin-like protein
MATIKGTRADDQLSGTSGDDKIDGREGRDTLNYSQEFLRSSIQVRELAGADSLVISGPEGRDQVEGVEVLSFGGLRIEVRRRDHVGEQRRVSGSTASGRGTGQGRRRHCGQGIRRRPGQRPH